MPLAITGSTGNVGGRVARLLATRQVEQRLLVRSPAKAPSLPQTEVVQASYADHDAVRRALTGVDVALMVSGSESEDRLAEHRSFVDAAAEAGVRHLVYTSFYGAAADATFTLARDHHHTEQHIERSGMSWTFLRDNLYLDFFPMLAGEDGVLRGPADDGRVAAVAQDDIAAVATAVLLDPASHEGRTYDLTGPEAITLSEAAGTMSRILGRDYSFRDETLEEAHASRASYGVPDWQVEAWVSTYTSIAAGDLEAVSDDVRKLTGTEPGTLADVLRSR
jgi:NAD(P)H dehydrogenase (quinone)